MKNKMIIFVPLLFLLPILLTAGMGKTGDWGGCASQLAQLERAAGNAAKAAKEVEFAREKMESKKKELDYCQRFPDIYNLPDASCDIIRWKYESAKDKYQVALSDLQNKLRTLAAIIPSVESSCSVQFTLPSDNPAQGLE